VPSTIPSHQVHGVFHQILQHLEASRTPPGLPGRFTTSVLALTPASPRENAVRGKRGNEVIRSAPGMTSSIEENTVVKYFAASSAGGKEAKRHCPWPG
jgi:hypothetical protein